MSQSKDFSYDMLKIKKWGVLGATPDESKFGNVIFQRLLDEGYEVKGINPKYDEINGHKIYSSVNEIADEIECLNIVVNPKIAYKAIENLSPEEVNNLWFQPGAYDDSVINYAKEKGFNVVNHICVLVALDRR